MAEQLKPIKLWGLGRTANPLKVAVILEELNLPYEAVPVALADVKKPEYTAVNPNGRLPAIYDPNNDLTLWESGAIIEYLVQTYDKDMKLSFAPETADFWHARQWLYFQASGQGPYYGQLGWYKLFEQEKNPSAIERYRGEAKRISNVLEGWLAQEKTKHGEGPWLVGNKMSYADISFIPWQHVMGVALKDVYDQAEFPHVQGWYNSITSRAAFQNALEKGRQLGAH